MKISMSYRNIEIHENPIKTMYNFLFYKIYTVLFYKNKFYKIYTVKLLDIFNIKLLKILAINIVIYFRIWKTIGT